MEIKGIGVSPGIAIGKACIIKKKQATVSGILLIDDTEIAVEIERFDNAVILAITEIEGIKNNPALADEDIAILETHIELIGDPQIKDDVTELITAERKNANDAIIQVTQNMVELFRNMEDEYMQARAADMEDIGNRILKHLVGVDTLCTQKFEPGTIIIADDLSPSDTITMDLNCIAGFATRAGSTTSHSAIIARARGLPAVVGCGAVLMALRDGDAVVVDGTSGELYVNAGDETIHQLKIKREEFILQTEKLKQLKDIPAVTTDGTAIVISGNISGAADMDDVFYHGGQGVGLFRTELLFMNRETFPTEDEQFEFYKQTALKAKGKPVIVRTIDIGGDKQIPYFELPVEENPFLGYRAIRICLDREDIFITQLKAILRASVFGELKIMLPMIVGVQELRQAKCILEKAKKQLTEDNVPFNTGIELGIMIEVPSAAIAADILAKEVDFFSIGTNDLCQYTLAVDRMNEKIAHLYDPFNPGVLRLIRNVIEQANKHQIHVGMCGEMAGNPLATVLLLGMGLKEFSMSATSIPTIKNMIIQTDIAEAKRVCDKVMELDNPDDIRTYLQQFIK